MVGSANGLFRKKRLFDLLIVGLAVPVVLPVMAIVWVAVRLSLGAPVLFHHERPGFKGRAFTLLKFRTMTDERDAEGKLLPDDERLGAFGKFLRSTSLDELPEIFNVLKGEMSLVGPRPLMMEYLSRYSLEQFRRHDVLPGITGWAQVNGRNGISWEEKFDLDLWYVDHQSMRLDLKILWMTVAQVLRRDGISAEGCTTMPMFMGSGHGDERKGEKLGT